MARAVSFLTTERQHIFDVCNMLMDALDDEFLSDPAKPVVISVRGAFAGGKKIFPDAARDHLVTANMAMKGKKEYDEYWTGTSRNGKPVEVDFINVAWGGDYKKIKRALWLDLTLDQILSRFSAQRKHGGVSFVHNCERLANDPSAAAIDICLEQVGEIPVTYRRENEWNRQNPSLRCRFNELANATPWARFIRIAVNSEELLASAKMQDCLKKLSLPLPSERPAVVPVYGVNLPRMASPPEF